MVNTQTKVTELCVHEIVNCLAHFRRLEEILSCSKLVFGPWFDTCESIYNTRCFQHAQYHKFPLDSPTTIYLYTIRLQTFLLKDSVSF